MNSTMKIMFSSLVVRQILYMIVVHPIFIVLKDIYKNIFNINIFKTFSTFSIISYVFMYILSFII